MKKNETKPETKRITKLRKMQILIADLIAEEARRHTQDREYVIAKMTPDPFAPKPENLMRPYAEDIIVQPGETYSFFFGVEHDVPDSGIEGLPETIEKKFGVERPFALQHLLVNDEDAPHFTVEGIYAGGDSLFPRQQRYGDGIPAARFSSSTTKRPLFTRYNITHAEQFITVTVKNSTNAPSRFRAKVVGKEIAVPETTETDVFLADGVEAA